MPHALLFIKMKCIYLNPIEIQWKVIKERLTGGYFATVEELEAFLSGWSRPERHGPSG